MVTEKEPYNELTICSLNCRGLRDLKKRRDVMNYLRPYSLLCLQDTHISREMQKRVRNEWGFQSAFSSYSSQARGVAIFINKNVEFKLISTVVDPMGNFLFLDIELLNSRITLGSIYAPNKDDPDFFNDIKNKINAIGNQNVIVVGDWNLLHRPDIDGWKYKNVNNPLARAAFLNMIEEVDLIDIWRKKNPHSRSYTWRKKVNNLIVQSGRLDSFLITNNLSKFITSCDIKPGYRTDHSLITLGISKIVREKRKTFWKFNNSLLKSNEFLENIRKLINDFKTRYISPNLSLESINSDDQYQSRLNPNLFLEVMLMEIRGECIRFASELNRKTRKREKEIEETLVKLHHLNCSDNSETELLQNELKEIREKMLEGTLVRSRTRWIHEGEKPTRYFCHLENRNFISKSIDCLNVNNTILKNEDKILEEVMMFYKDLYDTKDEHLVNVNLQAILSNQTPCLDEETANNLNGPITVEEASVILKQFSNNKSPGTSGFTVEFFKVFWRQLSHFIVRAMNYSCEIDALPNTLTQGIITCIPKSGKDKMFLKNWRPISLLNVTYKIFSGIIARRIRSVLPEIISEDQSGFMSKRFIGDNLRIVYDVLDYAKIYKKRDCSYCWILKRLSTQSRGNF